MRGSTGGEITVKTESAQRQQAGSTAISKFALFGGVCVCVCVFVGSLQRGLERHTSERLSSPVDSFGHCK